MAKTTPGFPMLDQLLVREYGAGGEAALSAVLDANPGLADMSPILPPGTEVSLPNWQPKPHVETNWELWGIK